MNLRYVLVQHQNGITRVTLNRPERLNALNVRVDATEKRPYRWKARLMRSTITSGSWATSTVSTPCGSSKVAN